ncbi:MAG: HDOD domain-containing protein [Nitrospirota bacterium]
MAPVPLETLLARVDRIRPLPGVARRVVELVEDDAASVDKIQAEILKDQVITARLLKLCNSAYYGFPRKIGAVSEAVVLLGFTAVRSLVLSLGLKEIIQAPLEGYSMAAGELWRHSLACALIARRIAQISGYADVERAYTAGLLHDIGKVALDQFVRAEYSEIVRRTESGGKTFSQAEQEILGFDHCQVGKMLLDHWRLPAVLVEAVFLHHRPSEAALDPRLAAITHAADGLTLMAGFGLGADGLAYKVDPQAMARLGLDSEKIEAVLGTVPDLVGGGLRAYED